MAIESLSKSVVSSGEEMLLTSLPNIAVDVGECRSYYCGVDCGSTQTRLVLMPKELAHDEEADVGDWFSRYIVIPSVSKPVAASLKLKPRSDLLFDNLDSIFSINGAQEVRLVRGSKIYDVETVQKELVSSKKKVTNEVTLYNIVDAVGTNLVLNSINTGKAVPGVIDLELAVSFPPDDMIERDLSTFHSSIRRFSWRLSDKMDDYIEVVVRAFSAYSEPAAQFQAYYTFSDEELPEEGLLLEAGGRNFAPVIFLNGAPVRIGLRYIEQSGSLLLDKIGMAYIEQYGGRAPSRRLLEQAISTGNMKYGNSSRNIVDIIKRCKDEVAEDVFQKLQTDVLSKQTAVSLESLNVILLSGRVYLPGSYNYSVANRLTELIKSVSPDTEVKVIEENRIPQGLVMLYLIDHVFE